MHRMQCMLQCIHNELHDSGSYKDEKANDDQKGRASLNADDLFYVASNQCDYWETLNVSYHQEKQTYM